MKKRIKPKIGSMHMRLDMRATSKIARMLLLTAS